MKKHLLQEMSWVEAKDYFAKNDIVILPVGSTEQHGPQNPLGTDHIVAASLASEVARRTGVITLPVIPYGMSLHHMGFPGTIAVESEVFASYVFSVVKSLNRWGSNLWLY
ncbi:MAG: hypothetical protein DRJ51_05710 [Thermoprotei archaeon]|nr:MAG: hypothetical protein DRJ51_05710 [Thermoprotei archaeon]